MLSTLYGTCWSSPNDQTVISSDDKTCDETLRIIRGVATVRGRGSGRGRQGAMVSGLPTSISELNKVQQFQFQTLGISLFCRCSEIIRTRNFTILYRVCYNFWTISGRFPFFIFIGEIDHFTLDLLKSVLLWTIQNKTTMNESLNVRL